MDALTRRSALAAGAIMVPTSCASSGDESVSAAGDDPTTIAAWVERRSDGLPTTYDELARLPHEAQLANFAAAAPPKKALIYRGYFEHLAARRDVTTDQRKALLRSAALVSPEWYEPGESSSRVEMNRLLQAAFGEDAAWIIKTVGPA